MRIAIVAGATERQQFLTNVKYITTTPIMLDSA
jgi:hypothetical protein